MPELPEVETIKTILDPIVRNKTVEKIIVYRKKTLITDPDEFVKTVTGKTFSGVTRVGKFLVFHLSGGYVIVSHLRMEGKYFEGRVGDPVSKHDILEYQFTDGSRLMYNDVRKFGIIGLFLEKNYLTESPIASLGKEPFALKPEELYAGLQKKHGPIKEALLDQTLISGLGNIYDDEVLFATKINPRTEADHITLEQCQKIIVESKRILRLAITNGGSTIRSYHPKEGVSGNMQNNLLAYGRQGQPCACCGFPLRKIHIGGRGTTYCPICQKEEGRAFVLGITGPIHSGKSTVSHYYEKKGYVLIDADQIVAELYEDPLVQEKIVALLGPEAVVSGAVDRRFLSAALADPEKKKALEGIIHPLVHQKVESSLASLKPEQKAVLDIPLLFGTGFEDIPDAILLVVASDKVRSARLSEEGKDAEKLLLLNKGWPLGKAKQAASYVIENNDSKEDLIQQLDAIKQL